ncbi:Lrp/AsnC family transcriptional regulator [Massilia cavernae]|uniref:AsnC family transcriptional regulator n=1 Tax=Massilia cavernae TaxID=2320864 RepID=A0A418XR90_9BURK|nr:AsnC family transcriptional regulator [Massilia cavernae]RJG14996.1 AsnC family transcriptional regulator [Massilia cavernae]
MEKDEKIGKAFDASDWAILRVLLDDSRTTLQEIGRLVGLSTTSCWNRIKRITDARAILGYTIKVDLAQRLPDTGDRSGLLAAMTEGPRNVT